MNSVRIDKWLWAVRLYKSRTLAAEACSAGHVKIGGQSIKPAREIQIGETIMARTGKINRIVKVSALLEKRVSAKLVSDFFEDLTPAEEYEKARRSNDNSPILHYPKGLGRPTKKQRRLMKPFTESTE